MLKAAFEHGVRMALEKFAIASGGLKQPVLPALRGTPKSFMARPKGYTTQGGDKMAPLDFRELNKGRYIDHPQMEMPGIGHAHPPEAFQVRPGGPPVQVKPFQGNESQEMFNRTRGPQYDQLNTPLLFQR